MTEEDPQVDAKWVEIQKKTFTRWANTFLKERMLKIDDLGNDLSDGTLLINLLEVISSKSVGKYNQKPKIRAQKLENTGFALKFLQKEGIKLVNIGNEDITDCKLKLILGLIWTIILRYQIHIEEGKSARSDLLKWVQQQIPEYGITNFTNNWNDGRAICALANSLKPGLIPNHRELNPQNALYNAQLGTDTAQNELDIPKVLAPEDMVDPEVDELSVMTYISYYRDWLANQAGKERAELIERTAVPERCRAYGPGYEAAEVNIPAHFIIEAINANLRRLKQGGDLFKVDVKGPSSAVTPQILDNNDGTYSVTYTPTQVGKHTIHVTLRDKDISNSPKLIPVSRSPPDASQCIAYGPGLEGGNALEPAPFTVETRNRLGDRLKDGGDPIQVAVTGPYNSIVDTQLKDNNDGSYSAVYHPTDPGDHVVNVTLGGNPIAKSPFHVTINKSDKDADASHCIAYGPGLEHGSTSELSQFTVESRNFRGERIQTPGIPIDFDVSDPNGAEIPSNLKDNGDGTFSASYQPQTPGTHVVNVILRNRKLPLYYHHIKDSPFSVPVEAGTDAGNSIAFGPGLQNGNPDTLPTHFTIQAKDKNGNNIKKGGDPFEVKIQGPKGALDADVKDNGDGTYTVAYQPTDAGKHKIDVNLKDKPIKDAPFTVVVKEGADGDHSFIEGYTFTIRAKTKKGDNKKDGGDDFTVEILPSSANVTPVIKDLGDGTYHVSYKLPQPGQYAIHVKLNGKDIKGSPWQQHV